MKCGRSNYQARDCKATARAKTPPSVSNANREPVQKKRKFDGGHLKITELGTEEDSGNEKGVHHQLSDVLLDTPLS